ncbi:MAG: DUF4097 domain-containing protein [Lachnospiraceae bacterium]|nr:DUF4097 domain-containing protein [Lachnospiraceae bacterium]
MNKAVKIILTVSLGILVIGILAVILGIRFGGSTNWGVDFGTMKYTDHSSVVEKTIELKDFDYLTVDVSSMDILLKTGDSYKIEYKAEEGREPVIEESNGKLKITQSPQSFRFFGININSLDEYYTITVPEGAGQIDINAKTSSGDIMTDHVNISGKLHASSGDILVSNSEGKELDLSASSGEIKCDSVKADKVEIDVSSGEIELLRVFADDLKCETSSGDININETEVSDFDAHASSGEVTACLIGDEDDFSYELKASSGDIKLNGQKIEDKYEKDNGTDNKIKIKTSSGDIDITVK